MSRLATLVDTELILSRTCTLRGRILSLKQDDTHLHYKVTWPSKIETPVKQEEYKVKLETVDSEPLALIDDTEVLLRDYLNLGPNLTELYERWSAADSNFKKRAPEFTGVRILQQDAWETLVGFICSSNNNIARISQMVSNLCLHYGPYIGTIHDQIFHGFPTPEALAGPDVEANLRALGFGYRARYLARTATMVANEKPENWLASLRNSDPYDGPDVKCSEPDGRPGYRKAHGELLSLQGVGPKVADCICLMGLGWGEAVPVDTHVWQIAQRDYKFGKGKHKSLTKANYDAVGDFFRELWGLEAGWAHSVLFAADLKTFAVRLVEKTEVKDEVSVNEEDGVKMKVENKLKREAMEEEIVKDEPIEDKDVLSETRVKRVRVTRANR